jgi:Mg2+ and Co2+ transporter CorA
MCSIALVTSIIVGLWGMNEYGVVPLFALLTLGGSFLFGTQLMLIITGE